MPLIIPAKGYLENTNKSVSEISDAVGYENALYFSRLFKKYTGMTPTEYKKANNKRASDFLQ